MHAEETLDLDHLAVRVRQGDRAAAVALRRELEPRMVGMVRQALCAPDDASTFADEARATAHRLRPKGGDLESLARAVAHRLCLRLLHRLREPARVRQALLETVVG